MDFQPGQMIGKIRLDKKLGEGAAGVVFRGHHSTLGIDVAVKLLNLDRAQRNDPVYRERFKREAQIAARLSHPCIVRVIDFGEHEDTMYLVMDLVDGFSLSDYLERRQGPLEEKTVLKVLVAVASGLGVAHDAGITHRDLKPANILLDRKGQLKLADLGLARDDHADGLTRDRVTVGTPAYMAPEALTPSAKTDHRVDLYALGVIGYRMAFGERPYDGTIQQIIAGHIGGQAKWDRPTNCRPEVIDLIKKLMSHDADARHAKAADLIRDARSLLNETPSGSTSAAGSSPRVGERKPTEGEVSGSNPSVSRTVEFLSLVNYLEDRFAEKTSIRGGGQILHSTRHERILVWCMLVAVVGMACAGYLLFG